MHNRTQTIIAIALALVLLASLAAATTVEERASLELTGGEVSRCVNRVCPITGGELGDTATAVEYRGELVGVLNEWAAAAWQRLPDDQKFELYDDIILPSRR